MPATYDEVFLAIADRPSLGAVKLNCTLREMHSRSNVITEAPVEAGANRAHHIVPQPRRLVIEGVISDRPDNVVDQESGNLPAQLLLAAVPGFNLLNVRNLKQEAKGAIDHLDSVLTEDAAIAAAEAVALETLRVALKANKAKAQTFSKYSTNDNYLSSYARLEALDDSQTPFTVITALKTYPNMVFESLDVPEEGTSDLVFTAVLREFNEVGVRRRKFLSDDFADEGGLTANTAAQAPTELSTTGDSFGSATELLEGIE